MLSRDPALLLLGTSPLPIREIGYRLNLTEPGAPDFPQLSSAPLLVYYLSSESMSTVLVLVVTFSILG